MIRCDAVAQRIASAYRSKRRSCNTKNKRWYKEAYTALRMLVKLHQILQTVNIAAPTLWKRNCCWCFMPTLHYFELNTAWKWVRVQPGVIREDELNVFLKPHGLFLGPKHLRQTVQMIGGMVTIILRGSNSVVYRSTREHLLEVLLRMEAKLYLRRLINYISWECAMKILKENL